MFVILKLAASWVAASSSGWTRTSRAAIKTCDVFCISLIQASTGRTFKLEGCSNYAFNLVLNEPDNDLVHRLMKKMHDSGIEFRRGSAGGGNQIRQPYLAGIVSEGLHLHFPEVEHVHFYGFYIGNFPDMRDEEVG